LDVQKQIKDGKLGLIWRRLVIGLVENLFSKGFVWKLRAVIRLDNTVSLLVETFDCPLHTLSSALKDVLS
jgi:hypothetical protein